MSAKAIEVQAKEIANKVGAGRSMGFVAILIPIVIALLPKLIEMFKSCTSNNPVASSPQKFVQHRYDDVTEIYDRKLLKLTIEEVRDAAKEEGKKLSKVEAKDIAIATLDQTRLAEDNVVGKLFR